MKISFILISAVLVFALLSCNELTNKNNINTTGNSVDSIDVVIKKSV